MPGVALADGSRPTGLRASSLLLVAAVLALLVTDPMGWLPPASPAVARCVTALKALLFIAFAALNWRSAGRLFRLGLVLVVSGLIANAVPSIAYGAMPYSTRSARLAGMTDEQVAAGSSGHVPVADIPASLRPLADVIPVPGLHLVASLGDLLLLGGVVLAACGMLLARRAHRKRG